MMRILLNRLLPANEDSLWLAEPYQLQLLLLHGFTLLLLLLLRAQLLQLVFPPSRHISFSFLLHLKTSPSLSLLLW